MSPPPNAPALGWGLACICWAAAMAWGCLQEASGAAPRWWSLPVPHLDKLAHASMHALLAWLLWRCAGNPNRCLRGVWIVVACAGYGLAIEWGQWQFTLTRSAEALDALANTLGAVLGVGMAACAWRCAPATPALHPAGGVNRCVNFCQPAKRR